MDSERAQDEISSNLFVLFDVLAVQVMDWSEIVDFRIFKLRPRGCGPVLVSVKWLRCFGATNRTLHLQEGLQDTASCDTPQGGSVKILEEE